MSSRDPEKSPSAKSSFAAESQTSTSLLGPGAGRAPSGTSGRRSDLSAIAPRSSPPVGSRTMVAAAAGPSSQGDGANSSSAGGPGGSAGSGRGGGSCRAGAGAAAGRTGAGVGAPAIGAAIAVEGIGAAAAGPGIVTEGTG